MLSFFSVRSFAKTRVVLVAMRNVEGYHCCIDVVAIVDKAALLRLAGTCVAI